MPVISVETVRSEPYADGRPFGDSGAYRRTDGVITLAVDPDNRANEPIVDIELVPRDDDGRVRFRSDFTLLTPNDPARGNRRLIVDVVNRGHRYGMSVMFNLGVAPEEGSGEIPEGDGFLFRNGYSTVSIGWQWDVYRSEGLIGLEAPRAEMDGRAVRGQTVVEMCPNDVQHTWLLADRVHQPYHVADMDNPESCLLVRDWEDGPDTEVPPSEWRFARETAGGVVPSAEHVYLETGFQPGRIYRLVYTTEGAPVVGTGLLAVREVATWLRHPAALNPVDGGFERVYAFGSSQTGRLLRHLVSLGLNLDEDDRPVFDGLMPHVAGGRRGEFNHRFAQPSVQSTPGFGHLFPFADKETTDQHTGQTAGLLCSQTRLGAVPKIMYTNTSAEYWRGDGSLVHVDGPARKDLEQAEGTRIYHFAGTQHGPGSLPQLRVNESDGCRGRYGFNVVDYRPLLRAALVNLDRWVSERVDPPASSHPRLDDGTAVTREEVLAAFNPTPDIVKPDPERLWVLREVDLGPEAEASIGRYPVQEGRTYPCFVSAIDSDGNEVAGVRLPYLTAPVATHAGWNTRAPETGAPEQIVPMQGLSIFFAPDASSRQAAGDTRASIQERYGSRNDYLTQVREQAQRLVADRYLLDEDVDVVVDACTRRYDVAMASARSPAEIGD
jgi:hypothetical protein